MGRDAAIKYCSNDMGITKVSSDGTATVKSRKNCHTITAFWRPKAMALLVTGLTIKRTINSGIKYFR